MNAKEPLFRVVKRSGLGKTKTVLLYFASVVGALMVGAVLLLALGVNPISFYGKLLTIGTIGNKFVYKTFEGFIKIFIPLLITSLGLSIAFKIKFWNIGGEGQFIMGAIAASAVALLIGDSAGSIVTLLLMAVFGAVAGGLFGAIPTALNLKFGTNETLLTLMLNYIALYILKYFGETQSGWNFFLSSTSARPVFASFPGSAWMPVIKFGNFSLNISLIVAVAINFLIYLYLTKTKHGFEISVVGDSADTARYAGIKVGRVVFRTMFISASLIGLSGAFCVSTAHTLSTSITNSVGWTGIVVAWISKLNTSVIFITSILITVLQYGCQVASSGFKNIDGNFADLLQGVILFSVLIADFLIRFRVIFRHTHRATESEVK